MGGHTCSTPEGKARVHRVSGLIPTCPRIHSSDTIVSKHHAVGDTGKEVAWVEGGGLGLQGMGPEKSVKNWGLKDGIPQKLRKEGRSRGKREALAP